MTKLDESRFSLIIAGQGLPMDALTDAVGMNPSKVIREGDVIARIPSPVIAEKDQWMYSVPLSNDMGTDEVLNAALVHLAGRREALLELAARYTVTMRLFVKSDMARMVYDLTPETLQNLCAVGLPLEISSMSWGQLGI